MLAPALHSMQPMPALNIFSKLRPWSVPIDRFYWSAKPAPAVSGRKAWTIDVGNITSRNMRASVDKAVGLIQTRARAMLRDKSPGTVDVAFRFNEPIRGEPFDALAYFAFSRALRRRFHQKDEFTEVALGKSLELLISYSMNGEYSTSPEVQASLTRKA